MYLNKVHDEPPPPFKDCTVIIVQLCMYSYDCTVKITQDFWHEAYCYLPCPIRSARNRVRIDFVTDTHQCMRLNR